MLLRSNIVTLSPPTALVDDLADPPTASPLPPTVDSFLSRMVPDPKLSWNFATYAALLMLVALWAVKLYTTWAAWGDLTIDSGHEMYVPALLAEGKMLYRDV